MPVFLRWFLNLWLTNPIGVRLVQNGGRRTKHMWIRAAYLAALILVLIWVILVKTGGGAISYKELAAAGARSFTWVAYLQITLICVLAPVFMGGAIAQEASPRTWEVLLTTPLTAGQIVLGNLVGRLFFVLALLFCSLPLFALTQYFGGVPGRSIFGSYFVAASAALLVGSVAIALSVSRLVGKRAFFVFYVAVVTYLAATIALDIAIRQGGGGAGPNRDGVTLFTSLNPFLALHALLNPTNYPTAQAGSQSGIARWTLERPVAAWCVGSTLLSLLIMAGSTLTVRAGGLQTLGSGDDGVGYFQKLFARKKVGGTDPEGTTHRAPRSVWHNPIAWREAASRNSQGWKVAARYTFLFLGLLFGAGLLSFYHNGWSHARFKFALLATVWGEMLVIALVGINTAATAISKEREEGTLDLLLTTPITAGAYLSGKLRGLVTYLLPLIAVPAGTMLLAGLYVLAGGMGRKGGVMTAKGPVVLAEAGVLLGVSLTAFMAFCVMVGLHWSLRSKGTLSSTVGTVGVVGVIAGIIGLCSWNMADGIPVVGPVLAGLSPAAYLNSLVDTGESMPSNVRNIGLPSTRLALVGGAVAAVLIFSGVCYGIHSTMVRTFDVTVRKLAGNK
jgi:ABC-type transport system involved in multi-copper enzyme maturation permease subunit